MLEVLSSKFMSMNKKIVFLENIIPILIVFECSKSVVHTLKSASSHSEVDEAKLMSGSGTSG